MSRASTSRAAPNRATPCGLVGRCLALAVAVLVAFAFGCHGETRRAIEGARHYGEGTAALEAGEPERAIASLERASRLVPHASEIQNHLGIAYWRAGRDERARGAFERALELDCDNEAARTNLARLHAGAGRSAANAERSREGREESAHE